MKTASEIVEYLVQHYQRVNGDRLENPLPPQVDDLVADMGAMLEERLEEDTPYQSAWDAFRQAPINESASLTGVLEALFEAQPGIRERVDSFMRAITALEVQDAHLNGSREAIEESLQLGATDGEVLDLQNPDLVADERQEKNPPIYLYGNERAGFESDRVAPSANPFMVGKNAEIIYAPTTAIRFPFLFMHLGQLSEDSQNLEVSEKEVVSRNLDLIHRQLTGSSDFDERKMTDALNEIRSIAPTYASTLIESLQDHLDELPEETQPFISVLNQSDLENGREKDMDGHH